MMRMMVIKILDHTKTWSRLFDYSNLYIFVSNYNRIYRREDVCTSGLLYLRQSHMLNDSLDLNGIDFKISQIFEILIYDLET